MGSSEFMVLARTQTRPRHPLAPSSLLFDIASVYAQHPYSGTQQPDTGATGELHDDAGGNCAGPAKAPPAGAAGEAGGQGAGAAAAAAGSRDSAAAATSRFATAHEGDRERRLSRGSADSSNSVGDGRVDTSSMPPASGALGGAGKGTGSATVRRDRPRGAPTGPKQSPKTTQDPGAKSGRAAADEERPRSAASSHKSSRGVRSHRVVPVGPDGSVPGGAAKDKDNCVVQ